MGSVSVAVYQWSNSDITAVTWKWIHFNACMDTKGGNNWLKSDVFQVLSVEYSVWSLHSLSMFFSTEMTDFK